MYMHTNMFACVYVCTYVSMYARTHVCTYACIYICTYYVRSSRLYITHNCHRLTVLTSNTESAVPLSTDANTCKFKGYYYPHFIYTLFFYWDVKIRCASFMNYFGFLTFSQIYPNDHSVSHHRLNTHSWLHILAQLARHSYQQVSQCQPPSHLELCH